MILNSLMKAVTTIIKLHMSMHNIHCNEYYEQGDIEGNDISHTFF